VGGLVVTALVAWAAYSGPALGGPGITTTTTTSTTHHETDIHVDLPTIYSTRVIGVTFNGQQNFLVYDQTFPVQPFASEVVNTANPAAELAVQAVALPQTITGPTLTSMSSTEQLADTIAGVNTSISTSTSFGPATILIGDDQSMSFFVPAGTENINTNTHTETFVNKNFQATISHRALWQVTGLLAAVANAPALSAIGLIGTAAGLVGLALWRLRRPRGAGSSRN
jgi:hypothetical protein